MSKDLSISRRGFLRHSGVALASLGIFGSRTGEGAADDVYQYIVVGSGAGGGPLCVNLANAGKRTLLLEAGDATQNNNFKIPAFWGASTEDPAFAWNFFGKQNSRYDAHNSNYTPGKGVLYPRAGTLGGCTAHNAMITMYPDNQDWENIVSLTGDRSWNARNMRRLFEKTESASYLSHAEARKKWRGKKGWLNLERTPSELVLQDPVLLDFVIAAALESGVAASTIRKIRALGDAQLKQLLAEDPNDWDYVVEGKEGVVTTPKATLQGRRGGTRRALLKAQAENPRNFFIKMNALVTQLLWDDRHRRIIGVEYLEGKSLYEADPRTTEARRLHALEFKTRKVARLAKGGEVILCGGAFNTPQLLMLSGIGPADELARHRIPLRVRREGVGKNLQDRYEVGVITRMKEPLQILKGCTFGQGKDACLEKYEETPTNSFYGTNGLVLGVKKRSQSDGRDPDLYLFALPGFFKGYHPGWAANALKADHITWVVLKGHTQNTAGKVTLRSDDPTAMPEIDFKYFTDGNDATGDDLNAVVEGVRHVRRINQRPNFRRHAVEEVIPGATVSSDGEVREFIQREAFGHHASCSNKMGPASDPMAVVDSQFKVHGVDNLRIVDASVFPKIPGLFIVLPTYLISEKASEAILRDSR